MPFLTAAWRDLLLANYVIDPGILAPRLPAGLELEAFQGRYYLSLVGFRFEETRFGRIPAPFHQAFEGVNLRFYVYRPLPNGERRRGVVFIREIVPKWAVTAVARGVYGEPYCTRPMRHRRESGLVEYQWKDRGRWHHLSAQTTGPARPMPTDSPAEFITEHYYGYGIDRQGRTQEYRVEHPRWKAYEVVASAVDCDFGAVYGARFAFLNRLQPASVMLAEGSEVAVWPRQRLS